MGAYMSEPVTIKESENGNGNQLSFGASTMQGWRVSQEDAHNCVADFDKNSSFFGVYDGHGGAEVAIYLSRHFPDLLKTTEAYLKGDIDNALIEAFLKMDASIKLPEVLAEIQKIAKAENGETEESGVDYEEENVGELYEEATMPLDKLVAKYQGQTSDEKPEVSDEPGSSSRPGPCSSRKLITTASSSSSKKEEIESCPSTSSTEASSASKNTKEKECSFSTSLKVEIMVENESSSTKSVEVSPDSTTTSKKDYGQVPSNVPSDEARPNAIVSDSSDVKIKEDSVCTSNTVSENIEENSKPSIKSENNKCKSEEKRKLSNGENGIKKEENEIIVEVKDKEESPKPRKGKVHPVPVIVSQSSPEKTKRTSPRKGTGLSSLAFGKDSDDSDMDSSDSERNPLTTALGVGSLEDSDSDSDEDADDNSSSSDDDDEDDDDSDEDEDDNFLGGIQEPGYDSGTTAVVAFLRWNEDKLNLWVANAGDSRCVLSRGGEAIEMSYDHKPESEQETLRIVTAGGKVTEDGRVNGGLNLSRAIGDHSYKQNETLPPEEQMISPLPTIQHIEIEPKNDDFIVLACDGVWNSMSSQQVVDFVSRKLKTSSSLSQICDELFDACLAPDTYGDGTGCDNFTGIIIQLPKSSGSGIKRSLEDSEPQESLKKPKVEDE